MHWNHLIITRGQPYFQPGEWICICQSFRGLLTYVNPVCVLGVILCCKCELDAKQSVERKKKNTTQHESCEVWKGQRWILKKQNHIHKHKLCGYTSVFYRAVNIYRQLISFVSSMPLFPLPWWRHSLTDERLAMVCWPASYFIGDMTDLIITHCSHRFNCWNLGIRQHRPAPHET